MLREQGEYNPNADGGEADAKSDEGENANGGNDADAFASLAGW